MLRPGCVCSTLRCLCSVCSQRSQAEEVATEHAPTPDFLQLLQEAPRLMQIILRRTDAVSSLAGTSRAMQALVQDSVRAIFIDAHRHPDHLQTMRCLVQGKWTHLQRLGMNYYRSRLNKDALSILIQGHWPLLGTLDLSASLLNAKAAMVLTDATWPLKHLNLSENPLGSASLMWLISAKFPLESLYLRAVGLTPTGVKDLVKGNWPGLRRLVLADNRLTAAAILPLVRARWPELRQLDLSQNLLTWQAVTTLTTIVMPRLSKLDLSGNLLCHQALQALSFGNWPRLQCLNLSYCNLYALDDVSGNWPKLRCLWLSGNCVEDAIIPNVLLRWQTITGLGLSNTMLSTAAVQQLVQGHWPMLISLNVDLNYLDQKAKKLLSDACQLQRLSGRDACHIKDGQGPWPNLRLICSAS